MNTTAKNTLSVDALEFAPRGGQTQVAATSFLALFSIVGLALYGLPFFYDFMVKDFGWTRAEVTSGNFYSKLLIGPLFERPDERGHTHLLKSGDVDDLVRAGESM